MASNDRMVKPVATQPANRRSPKAKQTTPVVPEADIGQAAADASVAHVETAMPPPTVTPNAQPKTVVVAEPVVQADAAAPEKPAAPEEATAPTKPDVSTATPAAELRQDSPQKAEKRQSVFFPMLLGGLIAGGIGYGVAYFQLGQTATADIAALRMQIAAVQDEVANLPPPDLSAVSQEVAALGTRIDERLAAMDGRIVQAAQQAPLMDDQAQQQAVAQLSDQIAAQQAELAQQRTDLQAQLDATRVAAEQIQQDAVDAARTEMARAALARVKGAIESGAPMQPAIDDLAGALTDPVPDALTAVAEGTPMLATLRETFPEASRAALAAARTAGEAGDDTGAFGSFLRNQLNVRSVAPRDGVSTDATLSRAEDALRNGRLNDTLAEVATLPASARDAMSDWITQAEARAAAVEAADQLDASLTAN